MPPGRSMACFRTFLLVAMKRFLINEWHKNASRKRGGHITHVPLDAEDAERRFACEPELAPDAMFVRWAMTLLEQALAALEAEFAATGKADDFQAMKHCLTLDRGASRMRNWRQKPAPARARHEWRCIGCESASASCFVPTSPPRSRKVKMWKRKCGTSWLCWAEFDGKSLVTGPRNP